MGAVLCSPLQPGWLDPVKIKAHSSQTGLTHEPTRRQIILDIASAPNYILGRTLNHGRGGRRDDESMAIQE